jgi:hypothetical protein
MSRRRTNPLISIGLLLMSLALIWHNFVHVHFSEFAFGLLMGVSIVLMIFGLIRQRRCSIEQGGKEGSAN